MERWRANRKEVLTPAPSGPGCVHPWTLQVRGDRPIHLPVNAPAPARREQEYRWCGRV